MKIWIISHNTEGVESPLVYLSHKPEFEQLMTTLHPFINNTEDLKMICAELLRFGRHYVDYYVPLKIYSVEVIEL